MNTQELLGVTDAQALRFFFERLRDVSEDADENELLYNASVLAHFASTSANSGTTFPSSPVGLAQVFDLFVLDRSQHQDPGIMEAAASHCLILTGFFGEQLRRRHNVDWYAALGADFYDHAGQTSRDRSRARMMQRMAMKFGFWRRQQARLAQELREQPLLIRPS